MTVRLRRFISACRAAVQWYWRDATDQHWQFDWDGERMRRRIRLFGAWEYRDATPDERGDALDYWANTNAW